MTSNLERRAIVAAARGWIGTPYLHQASLRGVGCDCLGLLRGVWRETIGSEPEIVPPYSPDWAEAVGEDLLLETARRHFREITIHAVAPGDIILFRWRPDLPAKHAAIVSAPQSMVHAHDGACVCEVTIVPAWTRRIAGAFAFPNCTT